MSEPIPPTIVVLDDNLLFSSGLISGLKRLGYRPLVLDDARTAVQRAEQARPAAILVNLASLRWDATDLVPLLKASAALADVPVVGYTGHQEVERVAAARSAGCDHVVANSAISGDLAAVMRRVLERAP